jgi:hypothetical protein
VAVHVVDLLEVVHVDHQREQRLAQPLGVREGALRHLHEMAPVVQAGHPVDRGQLLVPDREPAVVPQRGELARADQEGQQHRAEQHAAEGIEVHVPQADDGEEQIAARDREVGQDAGPGGGLSRRRHVAGVLPTRSWHAAATHKMVSASIHKVSTGSPPW